MNNHIFATFRNIDEKLLNFVCFALSLAFYLDRDVFYKICEFCVLTNLLRDRKLK